MNKYKCPQAACEHTHDKAGFCPDHGEKLLEVDKGFDGGEDALLKRIGDLVKSTVSSTLEEKGMIGELDKKSIFPKAKSVLGRSEKLEYVKSLIAESAETGNRGSIQDAAELADCVTEKETQAFLQKARTAYFFKHLVAHRVTGDQEHLNIVKALAEGVAADGGYLTPTEFRAELVRSLRDESYLRSWVTTIPMNSDSLEMPTQLTNVTTSWGSENTAISTTTVAFGTLTFAPKRLNTMLYTSRELVADSALEVIGLIRSLFVEAIGLEEDRVIVTGSGTGQPKGILQETLGGINNADVDANLADNIKKLAYRLPIRYRKNARWIVNPLALEAIATLKESTTGAYLMKGLDEGPTEQTLAGLPIAEQGDVPVDTLVLGDFKQYYLADRQQVSVETTTEGAGTFEKHQVAIKVVERIDGKVAVTNAFKTITNAGIV